MSSAAALLPFLLLLTCFSSVTYGNILDDPATYRIRRDIFDNIELDDPSSECRNGGIFTAGRCHCITPHTGKTCDDFMCVHGISVGKRFDPKSLFFNRPCICDDGWTGDLCEYNLNEKCNNHGEWKGDHCACIGFFFGPTCQYTSKCVSGTLRHGRCLCKDNWEGEYCHKIICRHGFADIKNKSMSCVCPRRYQGLHCDRCSDIGKPVSAYPQCEELKKKKGLVAAPRHHATSANTSRAVVIVIACLLLGAILCGMVYLSIRYSRSRMEKARRRAREMELVQRRTFLEEAAKEANVDEKADEKVERQGKMAQLRKASLGAFNFFRRPSATPAAILSTITEKRASQ